MTADAAGRSDATLGDRLAAALWRFLFGPVGRMLPFGFCRVVARPLGYIAWWLGVRRDVALRNLELAMPWLPAARRLRIGRESLTSLIAVYLEILTLRHLSDAELARVLTVENMDLLRTIGPKGAILLSAHYGNWELLAFGAAALAGVPFSIIVKEQRDYGQLERSRTARGNRLIPTSRGARGAAALMRSGGVVAMLADQAATDHDALVDMFGIPTYTFDSPARLALRFRPRVIAGFAARRPDGGYHVRLQEIPHDDLPDTAEGARELMSRYVGLLEQAVRDHPEQWVWQHRKWKNTPGVRYGKG
jgi:KDO2-lipid IV(A) lauroyltransferase